MPETVLRVRDLRKAYKDVVAVSGLDLEVQAGECFGLLGPNGAGKTTTIEICEGLTPRDAGELRTLEGVRDVRTDNGVVRMQVTALHSAVPALLAELVRRGIRLTELRTHSATLEDVFVTLTGRHLRDA